MKMWRVEVVVILLRTEVAVILQLLVEVEAEVHHQQVLEAVAGVLHLQEVVVVHQRVVETPLLPVEAVVLRLPEVEVDHLLRVPADHCTGVEVDHGVVVVVQVFHRLEVKAVILVLHLPEVVAEVCHRLEAEVEVLLQQEVAVDLLRQVLQGLFE